MAAVPYPVSYEIDRPQRYNRWTVAFRLILAIPQLLLVGASVAGRGGVLMSVLALLVMFAWFAILFTGRFPASMREFCVMIFRWSENVRAYVLLLAAPYPPFGRGDYPLRLEITPAEHYNRWTVAFRAFLVIPHAIALLFLGAAQAIVTLIAWVSILVTGRYPADLFDFSVGVSRWTARVSAYVYLFVDDYPSFSLEAEPGAGAMTAQPA